MNYVVYLVYKLIYLVLIVIVILGYLIFMVDGCVIEVFNLFVVLVLFELVVN